MNPDGKRIGLIRWPEQAVSFAFGGPDLRCCAARTPQSTRCVSKYRAIRIIGTNCAGSEFRRTQ